MAFVALRKESVDRNLLGRFFVFVWFVVALRKESVDRNRCWFSLRLRPSRSLSARRAWIEMSRPALSRLPMAVALRKESVDRNLRRRPVGLRAGLRRSPQGERG